MSTKKPVAITIKRVREDTYAEKFSITPMPDTATDAVLDVEGLGQLVGTIDLEEGTVTFPVTNVDVATGAAGTYDYDVIITAGGMTRTVVQGAWIILEREVTIP